MCSVELVKNTETGQSSDADPERDRRPEVDAPAPHREDLGADDRLGEEDQPEQEKARGEGPVDELSSRSHARSGDRRGGPGRSRARTGDRHRSRAAAAARGSRRTPCPPGRRRRSGRAGRSPRRRRRGSSAVRATRSQAREPSVAPSLSLSEALSSGPTISELTQPPRCSSSMVGASLPLTLHPWQPSAHAGQDLRRGEALLERERPRRGSVRPELCERSKASSSVGVLCEVAAHRP